MHLLHRALAQLTYCSLCPPNNLADRGLLGTPGALYAHDALQLWEITARWVRRGAEKWGRGEGKWGSGLRSAWGKRNLKTIRSRQEEQRTGSWGEMRKRESVRRA